MLYSQLNEDNIREEDYEKAKLIWTHFNSKT